jgi:hypothetical protein
MIGDAITVGAPALIVLTLVRIALLVRRPPGLKLPHPSKIGLPSGGLASPAAVHAALGGGRRPAKRRWWK